MSIIQVKKVECLDWPGMGHLPFPGAGCTQTLWTKQDHHGKWKYFQRESMLYFSPMVAILVRWCPQL